MGEESGQEGWQIRATASRLTTVHEQAGITCYTLSVRSGRKVRAPAVWRWFHAQVWLNCGNCGVMGIDAERWSGGVQRAGVYYCACEIHDNRHAATGKE
jgi:hypothetical protein